MKKWSSQWTQFMQLRKEAWKKFRTSTGFEPVTSRYRCDALPTELWSHWRWEQVNCGFICSHERNECQKKRTSKNCGRRINLCNLLYLLDILRLFQGGKGGTNSVKTEKLRALLHYFRRITRESKWLDIPKQVCSPVMFTNVNLVTSELYLTVLLRERQIIVFCCVIKLLILSLMISCFWKRSPHCFPKRQDPKKGSTNQV